MSQLSNGSNDLNENKQQQSVEVAPELVPPPADPSAASAAPSPVSSPVLHGQQPSIPEGCDVASLLRDMVALKDAMKVMQAREDARNAALPTHLVSASSSSAERDVGSETSEEALTNNVDPSKVNAKIYGNTKFKGTDETKFKELEENFLNRIRVYCPNVENEFKPPIPVGGLGPRDDPAGYRCPTHASNKHLRGLKSLADLLLKDLIDKADLTILQAKAMEAYRVTLVNVETWQIWAQLKARVSKSSITSLARSFKEFVTSTMKPDDTIDSYAQTFETNHRAMLLKGQIITDELKVALFLDGLQPEFTAAANAFLSEKVTPPWDEVLDRLANAQAKKMQAGRIAEASKAFASPRFDRKRRFDQSQSKAPQGSPQKRQKESTNPSQPFACKWCSQTNPSHRQRDCPKYPTCEKCKRKGHTTEQCYSNK